MVRFRLLNGLCVLWYFVDGVLQLTPHVILSLFLVLFKAHLLYFNLLAGLHKLKLSIPQLELKFSGEARLGHNRLRPSIKVLLSRR